MTDQPGGTVLILVPEGHQCHFCEEIDPVEFPYHACEKHYEEAKSQLRAEGVPTAEVDLRDDA